MPAKANRNAHAKANCNGDGNAKADGNGNGNVKASGNAGGKPRGLGFVRCRLRNSLLDGTCRLCEAQPRMEIKAGHKPRSVRER
jgi:hypothetical protein